MEEKRKSGGSTFDVIDKLDEAKEVVVKKLATISDAPLVAKCEAMLISFDELRAGVRQMAPNVEQLKGMTTGLKTACPVVQQHIKLLQQKYADPNQGDLLKMCVEVVAGCYGSVEGSWRAQREEMVRMMGKFDGGVTSCMSVIKTVEGYITNHLRLLEEEKELASDPFNVAGQAPEQVAGSNGARKPKAAKKAPRKKTTKKRATKAKAAKAVGPN